MGSDDTRPLGCSDGAAAVTTGCDAAAAATGSDAAATTPSTVDATHLAMGLATALPSRCAAGGAAWLLPAAACVRVLPADLLPWRGAATKFPPTWLLQLLLGRCYWEGCHAALRHCSGVGIRMATVELVSACSI